MNTVKHDIQRVKAAVQYLVDAAYFPHHVKKLQNAVNRPRSLPFKGEAEVLNELLVVGRQNRAAMDSLIALAEFKRDDHNDYQRKFMAAKRRRERKVLIIDELMTGQRKSADEAHAVLLNQYDDWNREKEQHIASCRVAYMNEFNQEPSWEQKNQFIKEFWALKDMELDMLEEEARRIQQRLAAPKKRVVVNHPKPKWTPTLVQKLQRLSDSKR